MVYNLVNIFIYMKYYQILTEKVSIYFKKTKYFENTTCKTSRDRTALHIPLNAIYSCCKEVHHTLW